MIRTSRVGSEAKQFLPKPNHNQFPPNFATSEPELFMLKDLDKGTKKPIAIAVNIDGERFTIGFSIETRITLKVTSQEDLKERDMNKSEFQRCAVYFIRNKDTQDIFLGLLGNIEKSFGFKLETNN